MKILITGGAGFIGSNLVEYFLSKSADVVVLDNFSTGFKENLRGLGAKIIEASVANESILSKACSEVDCVLHLAGVVGVPLSVQKPVETIEANVIGTLKLLEAAHNAGVKRVVFPSSASVYGSNQSLPLREDSLPAPLSPYALAKSSCEHLMKMYYKQHGLETVCLRLFNAYGPRQKLTSFYAAVIPAFISNALKNKKLIVFGDGTNTRDYVFVEDVVKAFELALTKGAGEAINIASGKETSTMDLAEKIISLTASKSRIVKAPQRDGDIARSLADISKAKKVIDFEPKHSLEQGLGKTIEFFQKNNR